MDMLLTVRLVTATEMEYDTLFSDIRENTRTNFYYGQKLGMYTCMKITY